ncbi:UvrD-helicase domain-containing protein [Neobacillus rhizophilus]|uniref:UvrD-helicase domain-containing protein n=1 Tax=Neobacillus rhizophilus TaxID=2833579 RepID=A0A942U353_9BACI|nr:UvrD-helicase domain-containing protein [Neobacillus rhizophilus]MBS4211608.1 UvrD-helicase domain-containing protein [Neobacillus rhizophilus]
MIEITNEDIDNIETILFPDGSKFNESHRTVIKNLETVDIKACPGSGKTTSLIAKLLILEKKLPLENNRGICVLTHTNVGVNEIKGRSSQQEGSRLFQYPNHISTIQVFVDKYLAIPSYKHFYHGNVYSIDMDTYIEHFKKLFYKIPWRFRQNIERKFPLEDLCQKLVFDFEDDGIIYLGAKKLEGVYSNATDTYQYLKDLKVDLLENGILSYRDAYVMAFKFIKEFPEIRDLISTRFKFLYMDEMQDTSPIQMKLLNQVFDKSLVTIQRIGDTNQAIFESSSDDLSWKPDKRALSISESKRFSPAIAKCIEKVCVDPQGVRGNETIQNIKPTIIVFKDNNIEKVLPTFADLIIENNLHQNNRKVFKAVGRVGKLHSEGKITLPSYYPSFNKSSNNRSRTSYSSLYEYILAINQIDNPNVNEYRRLLINSLLHATRIENIKNKDKWYSDKSLLQTIAEKNEQLVINLNKRIAKWILNTKNGQQIHEELAKFITCKFIPYLKGSKQVTKDLKDFCTTKHISEQKDSTKETEQINTYTHVVGNFEGEVKINLDTVYNVKGETHTATLYLETFYKKYDLFHLVEYLKQNHTKLKGKEKTNALCVAYVGLTRPTHFLCLAMRQETLDGNEEELKKVGWNIVNIKD